MALIDRINANVEKHALAAQASQYDRTVAITAIARARALIEEVGANSDSGNLGAELHSALVELHANYNDPDGVYTNGKGVLGSLIGDIEIELNNTTSQ
ncbi:MAG: hypothetical protein ACSHYC_13410 [Alphaproteobacteria bacterium]